MRKNIVTCAAMAVMGVFTGVGVDGAYAQSSNNVIVYGVVDINIRAVKNGDKGTAILEDGGTLNASRIGFKGSEDLGGGMAAGFVMESGFNADTGEQTSKAKFFNRRSTVSLFTPYGEIRLGHDNAPSYFNLIMFEPFGGGGVGSYINMFTSGGTTSPLHSGATTISRTDNGVGYFLPPNLGGLYGQAQITPSEGVDGYRHAGARLGYANGGIDIAVTYGRTWIANDKRFNIFGVGALYDFGAFKLMGQYVNTNTGMVDKFITDAGNTSWLLGTYVPLGAGEFRAAISTVQGRGYLANQKALLFATGYVYNLSKRTALYSAVGTLANKGGASYVVGAAPNVSATTVNEDGVMKPSDMGSNFMNKRSTGLELGIRHFF